MGSNNPLGNMNNAGWNLPANTPPNAAQTTNNNNQQLKIPTYSSGFPDIDTFLTTTAQYASNTMNNNMGLNSTTVDKINNNQSLDTQNLFLLTGAGQTNLFGNNVTLGNNVNSFASNTATLPNNTGIAPNLQALPPVTTNGSWNGAITSNLGKQYQPAWTSVVAADGTVLTTSTEKTKSEAAKPEEKTGELTMEQLFAQVAKPNTEGVKTHTEKPLSIADILQKSPNAVAGPTGAVFGRATNILGLPEPATQTTNPAFISDLGSLTGLSGLNQEKAASLATIANLYPELAKTYLQDTANKGQQINTQIANVAKNQTTTGINLTGMPSGFNQLYNASVQPPAQSNQADAAQRNETMRLIGEAFKATSKDLP
ncbi:MAG: hypothetical protein H2174_09535 [Vampirovibrio sp.]|nr:hypothetical protein [Vampirovibrio sp.]